MEISSSDELSLHIEKLLWLLLNNIKHRFNHRKHGMLWHLYYLIALLFFFLLDVFSISIDNHRRIKQGGEKVKDSQFFFANQFLFVYFFNNYFILFTLTLIQHTVDHGHEIKAWEVGKLLFSTVLMHLELFRDAIREIDNFYDGSMKDAQSYLKII